LGDTFCCIKAGGEIVVVVASSAGFRGTGSSGFWFAFGGIIVFALFSLSPRATLLSADFEFFSPFLPFRRL
jgi:hypothetical protein